MRSTCLVIALCGSAAAAPATKLTMKQTMDANIHLADQGGAINTRRATVLRVELASRGEARVVGTGTDSDHNLYSEPGEASWTTKEETAWTTTWKGTYVLAKTSLTLDLALVGHDCTKTKESSGQPVEKLTCETASPRAKVTCTRGPVELTTSGKPKRVTAWTCRPDEGTELAENASTWILGIGTCIEELGGSPGPTEHRRCAR